MGRGLRLKVQYGTIHRMSNNLTERARELNAFYAERIRARTGKPETVEVAAVEIETRHCTKCGHAWRREKGLKDYYCPCCGCASWWKVRPVYHCRKCAFEWKPLRRPARCPDCGGVDFEIIADGGRE